MNFRCKFRHRRSIRRPRFPIRVQNFSDLATFSVDFCILYAEYPPYFYRCLIYWPRKYTTHVDPSVDNSHQVWSRCDHILPSYSVLSANKSRDLVTFDCLTLNRCHTWRVTWPKLPPSIKTLRISLLELVMSYDVSVGYHWMVPCAMAEYAATAHAPNHVTRG